MNRSDAAKSPASAKHTPTPWFVEDPMGPDIGLFIVDNADEVYNWMHIATMNWDQPEDRLGNPFVTQEVMKANAAFIVQACNAYNSDQRIIAELRAASADYARLTMVEHFPCSDIAVGAAYERLREALAKAAS